MPDLHDLAPVVDAEQAWHIFTGVAQRRRARRRLVAVLVTVAVVSAGAILGALSLGHRASGPAVNVSPTTTPVSTVPGSIIEQNPCRAGELTASGSWQGAGGTMGGAIYFSNVSATPCFLKGRPSVHLLSANGERLPVRPTAFRGVAPATVALQPHVTRGAMVTIVWSNWCGSNATPVVAVGLAGSAGTIKVTDEGFSSHPRCDNPNAPSSLAIGPFEVPSEPPSTSSSVSTVPTCPSEVPLPAGTQHVAPVPVPCGCPTATITTQPAGEDARAAASRAALTWVRTLRHWASDAGRVTAIYRVGDTTGGTWASVFAVNVPKFCGTRVANASWVVEVGNNAVHDTGRQAAVVVAHFADGWQVWGQYT